MNTLNDYLRVGRQHNLSLVSPTIPTSQDVPVRWLCEATGEVVTLSLRQLKRKVGRCACASRTNASTYDDYLEAARERNITFLEEHAPANSRVPVRWVGSNGKVVYASLRQIKHKYTSALEKQLHG
jgi:hypothetical protein